MACKAEVLRIVGDERQVYTFMLVYHECIHQVISVERDGSSPDGAYEAALQQADVVVVDVDVRENIVQDRTQHVARTEEFFNTRRVHTFDDGFLAAWILAVDGSRSCLLDGDGQYLLASFRRCFYLILEKGELLVQSFFHLFGGDIV